MRIAIVSSGYGDYDAEAPMRPVPQDLDCEYVFVTDREVESDVWKVVVEPRPQLHPRLAAKVAKCRPDLYADADAYIWMDASMQVIRADFARWAVEHLRQGLLAQLPHPARQSLLAEARLSATLPKYEGLPVYAQVASYIAAGHPDTWGLWATGLIAYRGGDWLVRFGNAWLTEQVRWTYQDQLSEAPVLHHLDIRPVDLPGPLVGHSLFSLRTHSDGT